MLYNINMHAGYLQKLPEDFVCFVTISRFNLAANKFLCLFLWLSICSPLVKYFVEKWFIAEAL
mgnify:CR=1 FL=1